MEGAMLKVDLWNKSVPRVELDQRARDARLRLERIGRLLVPRAAVTASCFRWILCLSRLGIPNDGSRPARMRGPLSNRRPRTPQNSSRLGTVDRVKVAAAPVRMREPAKLA